MGVQLRTRLPKWTAVNLLDLSTNGPKGADVVTNLYHLKFG